jgi:hypothetical protein
LPRESRENIESNPSDLTITRALADAVVGQPLRSLDARSFGMVLDRAYELALFPLFRQLGLLAGQTEDQADAASHRHRRWIEHRLRQTLLRDYMSRAQQALADLPFVILKGLPLGERLYGSSSWRDSGDIDVLVRYEDLREATGRLAGIQFKPLSDRPPEPWVNNEYQLRLDELGLILELHWALTLPRIPSPPAAILLNRRVWHAVEGREPAPVLSPEDGFLQACCHFHHHSGFLKGLFDVAGWLDRYGNELNFEAIESIATSLGVNGIIQWPLLAIERLTGLEIPGLQLKAGWNVRAWSRFTHGAARNALAASNPIAGDHPLAFKTQGILKGQVMLWSSASMTLLDTPAARAAEVLQPIFLGPAAMAEKLGKAASDAETWIRICARPAELIVKQIRDLSAR